MQFPDCDREQLVKDFFTISNISSLGYSTLQDAFGDNDNPFIRHCNNQNGLLFEPVVICRLKQLLLEISSDVPPRDRRNLMYKVNIFIMFQTMKAVLCGGYFSSNSPKLNWVELNEKQMKSQALSKVYDEEMLRKILPRKRFLYTKVYVEAQDCCDLVIELQKERKTKWALLNMASEISPNGGWDKGHWAQEENITKRSNYYMHLFENWYEKKITYPIPEFGGVFSEHVVVFRGNEENGYPFLEQTEEIACIAVAAYDLNEYHNQMPSFWKDIDILKQKTIEKIDAIFKIAIDNGIDNLVLGAIGCGAFKNNPDLVSECFDIAIKKYSGCFEEIIFSIIGGNNPKMNNPNYLAFAKRFGDSESFTIFPVANFDIKAEQALFKSILNSWGAKMNSPKPNDSKIKAVIFSYSGDHMSEIYVTGSWCDWKKEIRLVRKGAVFIAEHPVFLPSGKHYYKFKTSSNEWFLENSSPSEIDSSGFCNNFIVI